MKHKPFEIPKRLIYEAWKSVKRAAGGAGVDGITIDTYEQNLSGNLYKLWNRMSSGSYLPPPSNRWRYQSKTGPPESWGYRLLKTG